MHGLRKNARVRKMTVLGEFDGLGKNARVIEMHGLAKNARVRKMTVLALARVIKKYTGYKKCTG